MSAVKRNTSSTSSTSKTQAQATEAHTMTATNATATDATATQIPADIDQLPTKSAKIRALSAEGWTRSQIAKALNIKYQHVRNVLVTPLKSQEQ